MATTNINNNMKITSIDLSRKQLDRIPYEQIDVETNWIILSDNKLEEVDTKISQLQHITRLALNDNKITNISPELSRCTKLNWVDLTRNQLRDLPGDFGKLRNISGLGLSENEFKEIPEAIFQLINLRKFGFFSNQIRYISPDIRYLKKLIKIDLSNNRIREIPEELCELKSLSWLNLSNNRIRRIPEAINNLSNLEEFGLGMNEIEEIPCIENLRNLRIFPVFKNRIRKIHRSVFQLSRIEKLDFSDNEIREFPLECMSACNLRYINFRGNQIERIVIENLEGQLMSKITLIDISYNRLKYLPFRLFNVLSQHTNIRLGNNPYEVLDPVHPTEFTLTEMCISSLLKNNQKLMPWVMTKYKRCKYYCDNCKAGFVVKPHYFYMESYFDPENRFVIEKTLCSKKCISMSRQ